MPNAKPLVTQNPARKKIISRMAPVLVRPILEHMFVKCYQCTMSIHYIHSHKVCRNCGKIYGPIGSFASRLARLWAQYVSMPFAFLCSLHPFAACWPHSFFVSAASKALHGTASFLNELLFRAAADAWSIRSAGRGSIRSAGCGISRRVYGKNLAHRHPQHLVMKIPHYCAWLRLRFDDSSMRMDGTPEVRGKNTTNGAPETEVFSDNNLSITTFKLQVHFLGHFVNWKSLEFPLWVTDLASVEMSFLPLRFTNQRGSSWQGWKSHSNPIQLIRSPVWVNNG